MRSRSGQNAVVALVLNVALQKQVRGADGAWRDAAVNPQTETDLENAILTKARQLRVNGRG